MLVLSRREKQRIRLGDNIIVTVVRVAGDKVRLGIEAPADILVLRDELETRTVAKPVADQAANQAAAELVASDAGLAAIAQAAEIAELADIGELVDLEIVISRVAPGTAA